LVPIVPESKVVVIKVVSKLALAPLLALGLSLAGCGGGSDNLPRKAVSGTITLDGAPLKAGSIAFDPESVPTAPVSVGAPVTDGTYSIARGEGPTPGTYRVSVLAGGAGNASASEEAPGATPKARAKDPIPEKYNAKTELKAEVKADGPNTFNFDLSSK
jgi:hypothetical protein